MTSKSDNADYSERVEHKSIRLNAAAPRASGGSPLAAGRGLIFLSLVLA